MVTGVGRLIFGLFTFCDFPGHGNWRWTFNIWIFVVFLFPTFCVRFYFFFPESSSGVGSRLGFGVQGLGRVRATLNPQRIFLCAQAAGFMRVGVLPCRRESSARDFYQ